MAAARRFQMTATVVLTLTSWMLLAVVSCDANRTSGYSSGRVGVAASERPAVAELLEVLANQSHLPFILDLSVNQLRGIFIDSVAVIRFNLTSTEPQEMRNVSLVVKVADNMVAAGIDLDSEINLDWFDDDRSSGRLYKFGQEASKNDTCSCSGSFSIRGVGMGHTQVTLSVIYYNATKKERETLRITAIPISVQRAKRMVDFIFSIAVYGLIITSGTASALKIDLRVVKESLKKPKAPVIGFFSQFIIMPLVSYGIIMLRGYTGGLALGLFAFGTGPGGGQSNLFTLLLDGDVSVSTTMTLVSTFACLGMMPLWLYTLGATLPGNEHVSKESIRIPFVNILTTIATIMAPTAAGLLLRWKFPRFAKRVVKVMKIPLFLVTISFVAFAWYTNWYVFTFFDVETVFSCALLPYGGFLLGGLVALAARFEWKLILTIAIETGINNVGVAIVLVQNALPQPDADLSLVPILAAQVMTPVPLYLAVIVYNIYKKCCKRKSDDGKADENKGGEKEMEVKRLNGVDQNGWVGNEGTEEAVGLVKGPNESAHTA